MYLIKKDGSGVFSNFMRAVDWFWYSMYTGEKICLDWNYQGVNLLSDIFEESHSCDSWKYETVQFVEKSGLPLNPLIEKRRDSLSLYRKYNGYFYMSPDIYHEPELHLLRKEMHKAFNSGFKYKKDFVYSENTNIVDKDIKTLGIHLRNPIHYRLTSNSPYGQGLPIDTQHIFEECSDFIMSKMEQGKFEKIFIACENQNLIDLLESRIGKSAVLYHKHERLRENIDWESKPNIRNLENTKNETVNCFIDVYNLSLCDGFIGTVSNMAFGVIIMNPDSEFFMFPMFEKIHGC